MKDDNEIAVNFRIHREQWAKFRYALRYKGMKVIDVVGPIIDEFLLEFDKEQYEFYKNKFKALEVEDGV